MNSKPKKLLLVQFVLASIFCFVLSINNVSFAQGENPSTNTGNTTTEKKLQKDLENVDDNGNTPEESNETAEPTVEEPAKEKSSTAYEVLGRKLTEQERDLYSDLDAKTLRDQLVPREQRLIVVRALIAVGESENIEEILGILPRTKLKTFKELVNYFKSLIEKYGTVLDGLKAEIVYNTKDDEQAFRQAASKAYEIVFGIKKDKQNIESIISFLKSNKALTYTQMVTALTESMTNEEKKEMLSRTLDEIGRSDLKTNQAFMDKILAQNFTYVNLKKLLQELSKTKPQGKK
ncbi:MAG: hypothetical protein HY094_08470 [Candidatus Melainabacteria bacterium]|nr:hypothetical protein [Candidatus Melainabacteria bacterium]